MPVDFFVCPCDKPTGSCKMEGVVCKTTLTDDKFGVSDAKSDERKPAFVTLLDEANWDLIVKNPSSKVVTFKAIDYCVDFFRDELNEFGQRLPKKRCEGFLEYDNKLVFIEIKTSPSGRWLTDAYEKFIETIPVFREAHPGLRYTILKPIIANRNFRGSHQSEIVLKKKMKDILGVEFMVKSTLVIE